MRVAIVGAGSQSTPHLFLSPDVARIAENIETTLIGRDDQKSAAVARAISMLSPATRVRTANIAADLTECFATADVVIVQARYGGYAARLFDETFPSAFESPGDEGLGAGGLANAWRSWPQLAALLERIDRAGSKAAIIFLTAPLGILTRCAVEAFPALRWYALCELPFVTLKAYCENLGVDWRNVSYDYAGVNHLGWFDLLRTDSLDVLEKIAGVLENGEFPDAPLIRRLHALPLKYFELHYERRRVTARQRASKARASSLAASAARALNTYATGGVDAILKALHERQAAWYYDAVGPFLAFLAGVPADTPFFLSTKNNGYLPDFDPDDVLEIPHLVRSGSLAPSRRSRRLAPPHSQTLKSFVEFERAAAGAVMNRSREALADAAAIHPWIGSRNARRAAEMICSF